jgi:hypothetical protein
MNDPYYEIQKAIEAGKYGVFLPLLPDSVTEPFHERLWKALADEDISPIDLAGLIRHFPRQEDEKNSATIPRVLSVPRSYPYPADRSIWEQHGMQILRETGDRFQIAARPWRPDWLDPDSRPEKDAFAGVKRRDYSPVEGDPFLSVLGLSHYRSIGQKEAIRAILTAPADGTLLVNLPTGAGKSLCAHLPAMLSGGVTIVVVPTVALAIDQERSLQRFLPYPTAYYGDDSPAGQQRRQEIRQRVRNGTQKILFTSPESVLESLSICIEEAARRGFLAYFIIDEVHIVERWGDGFRPEFQQLAGFLHSLHRIGSLKTILLTATLTESCLDTLESLFRGSGEFRILSAVQLRPEPSYWFARCADEGEKQQRAREAIAHLPRPAIVYTATKKDAYRLQERLVDEGCKRVDAMTGDSSPDERARLIDRWRAREIDIVVATSAFGLGMDQQDTRSVIHLCIPETIDRFYQEVGRGGRDGNASVSLVLYTDDDDRIAVGLNEKIYISAGRGRQRWRSMFARAVSSGGDRYRVPVNVPPSLNDGDIDMNNSRNRDWHDRTLNLMSQGGLIEPDWELSPDRDSRVIRVKNQYHLEESAWENYIEPIRAKKRQSDRKHLDLVREAIAPRPGRCLAEIFREAYAIPATGSRKAVNVSPACGGCPRCRADKRTPFAHPLPRPRPVWQNPRIDIGTELRRLFRGEDCLGIFYLDDRPDELERPIRWLIHQGMMNIISPVSTEKLLFRGAIVFTEKHYQPFTLQPVPTLFYLPPSSPLPSAYLDPVSFPRALILPEDTPDPSRRDRRLIDVFPGTGYRLSVFLQEIHS